MDELWNQTKKLYVGDEIVPEEFPKQIAFNVIPHGGDFMDDGYTTEEWKMEVETKKILDPKIKLTATSVRVPVFVGHSEAVNIEFENEITADEARELLRESPGIMVIDKHEDGGYATPLDCVGEFATYVSRIREDHTIEQRLVALGGERQPAQRRGAQRRADRRADVEQRSVQAFARCVNILDRASSDARADLKARDPRCESS
jgi:aspartate-semialdehyde dehydrogenase